MKRAGSAAIWLIVVLLVVITAMIAGGLLLWKGPEWQDWYRVKNLKTEYKEVDLRVFEIIRRDPYKYTDEELRIMRRHQAIQKEVTEILKRHPDWVDMLFNDQPTKVTKSKNLLGNNHPQNQEPTEVSQLYIDAFAGKNTTKVATPPTPRTRNKPSIVTKNPEWDDNTPSLKWVLGQVHAAHVKEEPISRKDIPYRILSLDTDVKQFMQKCLNTASSNSVVSDDDLKRLYAAKYDIWAIALKCVSLNTDQKYKVLIEEIWGRCPELRNEQAIKSVTERWADLLLGKPSLADEVWRAIVKRVPPERYSDSLRTAIVGITSPQIIENLNPVP